jgi:hypothetical protein
VKGEAVSVTSRPDEEARLLTEYANRVADVDRSRCLRLLCEASGSWFVALDFQKAFETMERCRELAEPTDPSYVVVQVSMGNALGNVGRAAEAAPLQQQAASAIEAIDDLLAEQMGLVGAAATALTHLEQYGRARRLLSRWSDQARGGGALAVLAEILANATTLEIVAGEWRQAAIAANELVRLATDLGFPVLQVWGHVMRADIAAAQGDELERETQLSLAEDLSGASGMRHVVDYYLALVRGKALLAVGEYELAASTLSTLEKLDTARGAGSLDRWLPDLAEALARAGREAEARNVLSWLEEIHGASGRSRDSTACWTMTSRGRSLRPWRSARQQIWRSRRLGPRSAMASGCGAAASAGGRARTSATHSPRSFAWAPALGRSGPKPSFGPAARPDPRIGRSTARSHRASDRWPSWSRRA